jgi:hypothetical protein
MVCSPSVLMIAPVIIPAADLPSRLTLLAQGYAGLASPALRSSAPISAEERPLTALASQSMANASALAMSFLVASMAVAESAIATLKYWKDGASLTAGPTQRTASGFGWASGAATFT